MTRFIIAAFVVAFSIGCTGGESPSEDTGTQSDSTDTGVDEPQVLSVDVIPDSVPADQTGMTDQYFRVEINVVGFDEEGTRLNEDQTDAFLQIDGEKRQSIGTISQETTRDTIVLEQVTYAWAGGLEKGTYQLGAKVTYDRTDEGIVVEEQYQSDVAVNVGTLTIE